MTPAPSPSLIKLDECPSTNTWLTQNYHSLPAGTIVTTPCQSAGRGQRGNSWESEPGANITMSMLLRPAALKPREQFYISEIVALAVAEMLDHHGAPDVSIKWPNDIYAGGDRKICGILIEHKLSGSDFEATIAGIGVNINQLQFLSDAPNPVSLAQLTGIATHDVDRLTLELGERITALMAKYDTPRADARAELHSRYLKRLWRYNVEATYIDAATGAEFRATIVDVEPSGMLHLVTAAADGGAERVYAFKEVAFKL